MGRGVRALSGIALNSRAEKRQRRVGNFSSGHVGAEQRRAGIPVRVWPLRGTHRARGGGE